MKTTKWSDLKIKSSTEQKILQKDTRKRDGSTLILSCIEKGKSDTTFVIKSIGQKDHFISKEQLLKIAEFAKEVK